MSYNQEAQVGALRLFWALVLGVASNVIAGFITEFIDFGNEEGALAFRLLLMTFIIAAAFWLGIVKNPLIRDFLGAQADMHHTLRTVRSLGAQYDELTFSVTIDGQQRYPQWELPHVMCALAGGVERRIRAVYVITPETFEFEGSHIDQEGEYFKVCRASAFRIDASKTRDVIRRVFLVSTDVVSDRDLRRKVTAIVDRHSENDLFGVKVLCPRPLRPSSDFAIYDENIVLKLEIEMFERRISSGQIMWSQSAINTYAHTWDSLWRSAEAKTPSDFKEWCEREYEG